MKEINKELLEEIKEYYKKFDSFMDEKAELSSHNRTMKRDFVDRYFEGEEAYKRKSIKTQIGKLFEVIDDVGSGKDPVVKVKEVRKEHLNFTDEQYTELMEIKNQIDKNKASKDKIDSRIDSEIITELCVKLEMSFDATKGIFNEWYKRENGKDSKVMDVADGYRKLIVAVDNGVTS